MKKYLKKIVQDNTTLAGRIFDWFIQALIIVSLISFSIETLPELSPEAIHILKRSELIIVGIFTMEYILRIWVADKKRNYIFSFYGIIDLLAILPFYFSFRLDLRSIRILRLFRIIRSLKLLKYSRALDNLKGAFKEIKEELILFFIASIIILYISAVGIYYFENPAQPEQFKSVFHSLWWALSTLTTVGYGDIYPITVGGKIFTYFILMIGLGIIAIPTGLIASALTKVKGEKENSDQDIKY